MDIDRGLRALHFGEFSVWGVWKPGRLAEHGVM